MTYPIEVTSGIAVVRLGGDFDLGRALAAMDLLEADRSRLDISGVVWDTRCRTSAPHGDEVRAMVDRFSKWDRVAILVNQEVHEGMARIAAALAPEFVRVCTDAACAQEWMAPVCRGEGVDLALAPSD